MVKTDGAMADMVYGQYNFSPSLFVIDFSFLKTINFLRRNQQYLKCDVTVTCPVSLPPVQYSSSNFCSRSRSSTSVGYVLSCHY